MGRGRVLEWRLRAMARLSMSRRVRDACCFAKFNSQTKRVVVFVAPLWEFSFAPDALVRFVSHHNFLLLFPIPS